MPKWRYVDKNPLRGCSGSRRRKCRNNNNSQIIGKSGREKVVMLFL